MQWCFVHSLDRASDSLFASCFLCSLRATVHLCCLRMWITALLHANRKFVSLSSWRSATWVVSERFHCVDVQKNFTQTRKHQEVPRTIGLTWLSPAWFLRARFYQDLTTTVLRARTLARQRHCRKFAPSTARTMNLTNFYSVIPWIDAIRRRLQSLSTFRSIVRSYFLTDN